MNCSYVRQLTDSSPCEPLQRPEEFGEGIDKLPYYKNITLFTNPNEKEALFCVNATGYEVTTPDKSISDITYPQQTVFYFVISGEGYFNNKLVKRGSCFIAEHNKPHSIRTKDGLSFTYCWITISHSVNFSVSFFDLDPQKNIIKYDFEAEIRQAVYSMQTFNPKARDVYFFTMGKLFEIVSLLRASGHEKATEKSASVSHARYVTLTKELLEESGYRISIEEIAKAIGFSRKYLSMIFCQTMGMTLRDYITQKKIERAKAMLAYGEASLKTIAFQLNYNDYSSFSRAFKKESGLTPHEYLSAHQTKTED